MSLEQDRRLFLKAGATLFAASALPGNRSRAQAADTVSPNETIRIAVMGVNGRGLALARSFMAVSGAEVVTLCDVDSRAADRAAEAVAKAQSRPATIEKDIRKVVDDSSVDVLVVAAPNHWHAPATILGCAAGKHVYVEKPCSQTAEEGELAVQAARKYDRVVQMGSQRRSWPAVAEGIEKLHAGAIGEVLYARTWYNNRRAAIGTGQQVSVPDWLDWDLWQGPAPRRPFVDNIVHYNWHWHWHWGNGELGNNGVHGLDVARWGLQVTYPTRVTAGGGKYRHDDDQETPDTMMVTYDFPEGKTITWEGLSWSPLGSRDSGFGVSFHGTNGSMVIRDAGYVTYDMQNRETGSQTGAGGDADHLENFLSCIRTGDRPRADIEEAHRSTLMCHLGNIAYRTSSVLTTDAANGHIVNHAEAAKLWGREYDKNWEPKV
jgi:predicted dehydrogenase